MLKLDYEYFNGVTEYSGLYIVVIPRITMEKKETTHHYTDGGETRGS